MALRLVGMICVIFAVVALFFHLGGVDWIRSNGAIHVQLIALFLLLGVAALAAAGRLAEERTTTDEQIDLVRTHLPAAAKAPSSSANAPAAAFAPASSGASAESSPEARALLKQAETLHFDKRFDEAITLYKEVIARFADSKEAAAAARQLANLSKAG